MRFQSKKRARVQQNRRRTMEQIVAERGPWCEALVKPVCTFYACDGHELVGRGRGGSITDPENIILVCRPCHMWITGHPEAAQDRGLSVHSWDATAGDGGLVPRGGPSEGEAGGPPQEAA